MKKGRKRFGEPLSCADRNEVEKVNIMGGTVIETESEKLIRQGMQQGMQQGIQQGMQQGIQQGIQQGMQQGI